MMTWIEYWVMRSWWLVLIGLVSFGLYEQGVRSNKQDLVSLHEQLAALQVEHSKLTKIQEELRLQVSSQSDPQWIEQVLMRGLGLVPENQTKVFFSSQDPIKEKWTN